MLEMLEILPGNDYLTGKVLFIDKPFEWTSFDLVHKVRHELKKKYGFRKIKVGHAGTLDPLATGLMIICTGKFTKEIQKYQDLKKEYIATIKLGETTPSFDRESKVDEAYPIAHIDERKLKKVLDDFIGEQEQIPPVFSAKNIGGIRAYEYARKGEDVKLMPKKINLFEIELLSFQLPVFSIRVACSKGTYIRALARDIGIALQSGAHLIALQRTAVGNFTLDEAISFEEFKKII
jgi:tRNA pseudouridine55 synthase